MEKVIPQPKGQFIVNKSDVVQDDEKKEMGNNQPLPFLKLLSYADALDWALMALGTLGSIVHGMAQPVGYLLLGKALDAFGNNVNDDHAMVKALYKVMLIPSSHEFVLP